MPIGIYFVRLVDCNWANNIHVRIAGIQIARLVNLNKASDIHVWMTEI
jgi:hypothetical protein